MVGEELSNDAITRDFRILQRRRGHRYALDDVATAWEAVCVRPDAKTYLDLGCGIGSVLLMVSWRLPGARIVGIEALEESVELARRNVAHNGLTARCQLHQGDLRELTRRWREAACDLVTGTPPYLPVGTALASPDRQRAAARLELRGGVEDYLAAAARVLAPAGRVVVCADGRRPDRVLGGASRVGLTPVRRRDVYAREGDADPLFSLWTLGRAEEPCAPCERLTLNARNAAGERTDEAQAMREAFGLEPSAPNA